MNRIEVQIRHGSVAIDQIKFFQVADNIIRFEVIVAKRYINVDQRFYTQPKYGNNFMIGIHPAGSKDDPTDLQFTLPENGWILYPHYSQFKVDGFLFKPSDPKTWIPLECGIHKATPRIEYTL